MSDLAVIVVTIVLLLAIYLLLRMVSSRGISGGQRAQRYGAPRRAGKTPKLDDVPQLDPRKFIVVDGSNVMHWGGDPSALVLNRVLVELGKKGLTPLTVFDANVGYKLWNKHVDPADLATKIGVDPGSVEIAPSGTTADQWLLDYAIKAGLRVVSNDRFLDWRSQFPVVAEHGFLVKGTWKQGSVMLRGL